MLKCCCFFWLRGFPTKNIKALFGSAVHHDPTKQPLLDLIEKSGEQAVCVFFWLHRLCWVNYNNQPPRLGKSQMMVTKSKGIAPQKKIPRKNFRFGNLFVICPDDGTKSRLLSPKGQPPIDAAWLRSLSLTRCFSRFPMEFGNLLTHA